MNTPELRVNSLQHAQCAGCAQPMQALALEGHYTTAVEIDLCPHCHLVWFDAFESVRLSGLGWVQLLRHMMAAPRGGAQLPARMACARCKTDLKPVRNLTRFGRFAALECAKGHGQYQSFSLLLAERGLVRPVLPSDRRALAEEKRDMNCLNCGAQVQGKDAQVCAYCDSPLAMVDLPRLTSALLVRHGVEMRLDEPAKQLNFACPGCGQPLDPTQDTRCDHCDHSVALPNLHALAPLLDRVEPILRGLRPREARPWGARLREMRGDVRATQVFRWAKHLFPSTSPGEFDIDALKSALSWLLLGLFLWWMLS
jgi:Transcription factor zinc-finger